MKLISFMIIILFCLFTLLPTVQAATQTDESALKVNNITNNIKTDDSIKENLIEKNTTNNTIEDTTVKEASNLNEENFKIMLSGILNNSEDNFNIDIVYNTNIDLLEQEGIWIQEEARNYFIVLINALSNKNYKINNDGFLVEDTETLKSEIEKTDELNFYTEKIDELIDSKKLIVITISDKYKQLNEIDNEIIDIKIEDDEYTLLFKENEEDINSNDIIILNSNIYNENNNTDTISLLLNNLLEVYYNEDENFKNFKENTEFIDNSGTYKEIIDNKEEVINQEEIIEENIANENSNTIIEENVVSEDNIEVIEKNNIFDDRVSKEEFELLIKMILTNNNNNNDSINFTLENNFNKNGIWISENSRNSFLGFLNAHTIYTYSCDSDGYLICDNIMKENPNLDILEKSETEFDIEYKKLINEDKVILIDITNTFLQYDDNKNIIETNLTEEEYVKTFSNDENRIILLNSNSYNNYNYDLALSDYFVKSLENVQEKVITGELSFNKNPKTRSDTSKPGNMKSAQNVYAGPDSSNYFKVGSVSNGEMVYLLGQQAGWYHIQYMVTGTSQQKSGFVPVSTVNNNGYSVHEEQMTGGQKYPKQGLEVMSVDDSAIYVKVGSVYQGEGVTVLYDYGYSDSNKGYGISYIEFSTSSGTKRGYVYTDQLENASYPTSVARVIDTNSAYAGPDNSFVKLGGAYYNEFVTVLAKNTGNDWAFVEYNTPSGRKRGYMSYSKLYNYNHPGIYNDLATNQGLRQATQQLTVYGGPNNNNANIGTVFNQEVVSFFGSERGYAYVEYSTTNGAKRGYVLESSLTGANPPSLPNIPAYSNFTPGVYGKSGNGIDLKYYKIGDGDNVAFAVFEQHGWEDAWAYDGVELINIVNRVMSNLSSTGINNNWTLYVIPYANPDGVLSGYTNNGPGRCTVTTGIDMNRCWPANFKPYYTSRNYTGPNSLGAPEAQALKNFISNNIGNQQKIILDIHGWLNQTYGDSSIAQYFGDQFNFGHSSTYGSGYLETWGKSIGAKSCLVELPMPSSAADITNRDFSGKLTNAIRNMLNGVPVDETEGGTEVDERVKVNTTGNLNVRSGPGTSYSIVSSISGGTIITRIRKNVATNNGYTWDKVRLNDGKEGYVATNYLTLLTVDDENTLSEEQVKAVKAYCKYNKINNYNEDINGTYTDELYLTIKEFQRINELAITGYVSVNDATWNAMEFNNTSIYATYKEMSENYITYDNPYGPKEFAIEDTTAVFKLGITRARLSKQDEYALRDSKYNTMSATDKIINASSLSSSERFLQELAILCNIPFPHASKGIVHFLSKEGGTHIITDAEEIFSISQGQKEIREKYLEHTKTAIKNLLTVDKAADFSMVNTVEVTLPKKNLDWFGLFGGYHFSVEGSCYKSGNGYVAVGKCYVRDYYDFDKIEDLSDIIDAFQKGGNFDEEDLATSAFSDLHYAGMARFYYIEGYDKGFELYF